MYVCVCHAVTEQDVRAHVADGACTPKDVRLACGMRPGCGSCVRKICALIGDGERVAAPGSAISPAG
jgi:bacterioferritin-associated ferredoxin